MTDGLSKPYKMIDSLTGLRGIAALWVFVYHFYRPFDNRISFGRELDMETLKTISSYGWLGVDIFFILSGFIMAYVYHRHFSDTIERKKVTHFYLMRLARIYPLQIVLFLLVWLFTVMDILPGKAMTLRSFFLNATLTQGWGIGRGGLGWNSMTWSVSAEWFAYLLFPLIFLFISKIRGIRLQLGFIIIIGMIYYALIYGSRGLNMTNGTGALVRVTCEFLIGNVLFMLYRRASIAQIKWDHVFVATLVAYFAMMLVRGSLIRFHIIWLYVPIPLLIISLACSGGYIARIFGSRLCIYLGLISYALYMTHGIVLRLLKSLAGDYFTRMIAEGDKLMLWLHFLLITGLCVGTAAFFFHLVEDPVRRYIKAKLYMKEKSGWWAAA